MEVAHASTSRRAAVAVGAAMRSTRSTPLAFAIAFAAALIVGLAQGTQPFYYDAATYWQLGASFTQHGSFSLLSFDSPMRGYLLPLVAHGLSGVAQGIGWSESSVVVTFNAAAFALIGTVLGPRLAELTWPERSWSLWRRLALTALLLVFWHGYLSFPLSDFPALAAVLLALVALSRPDSPGWMLVAGLATAAAIEVRPAYLPLLPLAAVLIAVAWWRQRGAPHASAARRAACVAMLLAGVVLVSLPQSLASHRHFDTWSPVPGAAGGLSAWQFTDGLTMQRYDTYVGDEGRGARLIYEDPAGSRLLAGEPNGRIDDVGQYAALIAKHPIEMAGVFGRHIVNGLDQRYPTPYIKRVDTGGRRWARLAGFLLVFVALARVAWPRARRALGAARWRYPAALLLSGASSIASAVEARFLLPVVLLSYVMLLTPGWPRPRTERGASSARRFAVLAVALVAYLVLVQMVVDHATDHLV